MTEAPPHTDIPITEGRAAANGLELAYEDWGDEHAPPILLVMGWAPSSWAGRTTSARSWLQRASG